MPSRWTAVMDNEGDYILGDNIQIKLTSIYFYIPSGKTSLLSEYPNIFVNTINHGSNRLFQVI